MAGNNLIKSLGIAAYILCGVLVVVFVLPLFGWKALEVITPSMKPAISPGDLVIVHRVPLSTIQTGNIVTYLNLHEPGTTITHRVIAVKTIDGVPSYIVKGDANSSPDAPVAAGQVVGRVALIVPGAGRFASILHNPIGLLALVILPAIYVIWSEVNNVRKLLKQPGRRISRRLDGVYRVTLVLLAAVLVISLGGVTLAQLSSTATLSGNSLAVNESTSPSPTPTASPSPTPCSVSITNTGPGSTNIVHCTQSSSSSSSSSTNVSVTNSSTQTATSGGVTIENNSSGGNTTPSSVSNNSSSVTNISISK